MKIITRVVVCIMVMGCCVASASAQQTPVRVADYNIKFLSTGVSSQGDRLAKLKEVIQRLNAQVIGLQEIDNRAALELLFPPTDWSIIIDNDSADSQDVAIVVKKPLRVIGVNPDLDADDQNFLFPGSAENSPFPSRRDLLFVEIGFPGISDTFFVMVHHAKARVGGRAITDPRREEAARKIVEVLEQRFDGKNFILLGDFNDNPDDRSLNILETGNPAALGGAEEIDGPFLINLMEPLVAAGHVSHGRTRNDIVGDRINTIDVDSRQRNNSARGTNTNTGDILFDQLLIPVMMRSLYVTNSVKIFDHEVAMRGTITSAASDHLPVYADFVFGATPPDPVVSTNLRIVSLLPNPSGEDMGNEQVTIGNFTASPVSLSGWKLRDRSGKVFTLTGSVPANDRVIFTLPANTMPLNNNGDDVFLIDPQGNIKHQVSYNTSQATSGTVISFP
jgi:endonuclease/exonuclease/phosphatase family metal-dependent hydrolase